MAWVDELALRRGSAFLDGTTSTLNRFQHPTIPTAVAGDCSNAQLASILDTPTMQTGLIQNAHNDLVTDAAYDFYGLRLATSGLDQR